MNEMNELNEPFLMQNFKSIDDRNPNFLTSQSNSLTDRNIRQKRKDMPGEHHILKVQT